MIAIAITFALVKLLRQAFDQPRNNTYQPQEKGKVREKLATNVTIVVVTLIQLTSFCGILKDVTQGLLAERF